MTKVTEQRLQEIFQELDRDNDGKVDNNEVVGAYFAGKQFVQLTNSHDFLQFIKAADSDNDGKITFEEFKQTVQKAGNLENAN